MGTIRAARFNAMKIVLASQSPFRKHALNVLGIDYETIPSNLDESSIRHDDPHILARLLSEAKSKKIGEGHPDSIVIAADCFVVHNNKIYEKPVDIAEAKKMLTTLSGNTFGIITGLAVYNSTSKKMLSTSEVCEVKFRDLSKDKIENYINTNEYSDKAGAYAIQGVGTILVDYIEGSYTNVVGLPISKLDKLLERYFNISLM